MAFGFTPKHEVEINLNGFDPKQYLAICLIVAEKLKWRIGYISKSGFTAFVGKSMFSSVSEFKLVIVDDVVSISCKSLGSEMFDWGRNKERIELFTDTVESQGSSVTDEEISNKLAEINGVFETEEEDALTAPPATAAENLKGFLHFFVPRPGFYITPIIINLNLLIFVLMLISGANIFEPSGEVLIAWGANLRPLTLNGQWWRLITCTFLHIGIFHLLMNMYALLFIGILLEPHLGRVRYLSAYLLTGIIASLASIFWHDYTLSAGASGAIFGLYGVFLAMLTTNFIEKSLRKELLSSIGIFVVFNLLNGIKGGIDNAAHIGGLVSGLIIGYLYYPGLMKPADAKIKYGTLAVILIITAGISFIELNKLPDTASIYDVNMQLFSENEKDALKVLNVGGYQSQAQVVEGLKSGITNWKENLKLLSDIDKLNLPDVLVKRNQLLTDYSKVRLRYYELMLMEQAGGSPAYETSMDSCRVAADSLINELKALQQGQ